MTWFLNKLGSLSFSHSLSLISVCSIFQIKRSFLFFMSLKSSAVTFESDSTYGLGISGEMHEALESLQLSFKVKARTKAKRS